MTRRNKSGRSVRGILSGGKKDADGSSLPWRSTLITSSTHMKRCWWSCQKEQVRDAERSGISSSVWKWMEDGYVVRLVMVVWWCYDRWWSTCNDHLGPFDEWRRGGVIISNFVLDRIPGLAWPPGGGLWSRVFRSGHSAVLFFSQPGILSSGIAE